METAIIFFFVFAITICSFFILNCIPTGEFLKAQSYRLNISLSRLVAMRLRETPIDYIIEIFAKLKREKIDNISLDQLEQHYLIGGNVSKVVDTLINAKKRGYDMDFKLLASKNLAGDNLDDVLKKYEEANRR